MHSPGESLKQEREARGRTIEEMAAATGIRPDLLTALEQEAFDSLPGRGFGKLYIRAYAEVLGFDPRPVIEAYDGAIRGRQEAEPLPGSEDAPRPVNAVLARWRQELMAGRGDVDLSREPEEPEEEHEPAAVVPEPEPAPERAVSPSRPAPSGRWLQVSLLLVILLPGMAWLVSSRSTPDATTDPTPVAARKEPAPGKAVAQPPSRPQPLPPADAPRTTPRTDKPAGEATGSSLRVAESGLGLRIVGTRLEGEGDRFRTGQRVTFATRVLGGGAGDSISHVWLRDGRVEQSIPLRLGGASWRTHSTKTLGRPGAWAVEARDAQGRVLARVDLTAAP